MAAADKTKIREKAPKNSSLLVSRVIIFGNVDSAHVKKKKPKCVRKTVKKNKIKKQNIKGKFGFHPSAVFCFFLFLFHLRNKHHHHTKTCFIMAQQQTMDGKEGGCLWRAFRSVCERYGSSLALVEYCDKKEGKEEGEGLLDPLSYDEVLELVEKIGGILSQRTRKDVYILHLKTSVANILLMLAVLRLRSMFVQSGGEDLVQIESIASHIKNAPNPQTVSFVFFVLFCFVL